MLVTFNYEQINRLKNLALEDQLLLNTDVSFKTVDNGLQFNHIKRSKHSAVKPAYPWLKSIRTEISSFQGHLPPTQLVGDHFIDSVFIRYISGEVDPDQNGAPKDLTCKSLSINCGIDTHKFTIMLGQDNLIHLDEILYLHGSESLSCLHVFDRNYRIRMNLTELAATISHPYFIKVKECSFINAEHLYAFNDEDIYLKYKGKMSVIHFAESKLKDQIMFCGYEDPGCVMPVFLQKIAPEWHPWFLKVETIMTKQLGNRMFSINNVANELGNCSRQFQRNFIQHSGVKPKEFAMELRLSLAHRQLEVHGSKKMEQIALQSGFKEVQHFKKVFKKRYGIDPASIYLSGNR